MSSQLNAAVSLTTACPHSHHAGLVMGWWHLPFPVRVAVLLLLLFLLLLLLLLCLPAQSSPLLAGLLTPLSSPTSIRSPEAKPVLLPTGIWGKDPFSLCSLSIGMQIPLGFLFHCQALRMEVRGNERCSRVRSPGAARAILGHLWMSMQIATMSTRDREKGSPVWRAVWCQGVGRAKACPPLHGAPAGADVRWLGKVLEWKSQMWNLFFLPEVWPK